MNLEKFSGGNGGGNISYKHWDFNGFEVTGSQEVTGSSPVCSTNDERPPLGGLLALCRTNTGREPEGRERKMRGSGGASNSERVKPPEGGGADRQTCQRQGCKAPYAPPLKILENSIVSGILLFDGNPYYFP